MPLRSKINRILKRFESDFDTHNRIEVSGDAIRHNLRLFKETSDSQVIPVLKGNAYGHGIELVAQSLKGQTIPYIAVDGYFEALRIRTVSKQPVLIMGAIKATNFKKLTYDDFAFVVSDEATVRALGEAGRPVKVHLECNTGMNRYGAEPDDVAKLTRLILGYEKLELEGVMSHLADSDGDDPRTIRTAVAAFDAAVEAVRAAGGKPRLVHLAQSAGSQRSPRSVHANVMRLGIGLYGLNPFPVNHSNHARLGELRPALQLISTITAVHQLQAGDEVSYNYTFTAPKAMRIGVMPLGYYEGLNRALSNVGSVMVDGHDQPIIGRVCMNHTMISLDGMSEDADHVAKAAEVGDEVVVYASDTAAANSIDRIAQKHGLFNYNLLTALSPDVRRRLVD